MPTPKEHWDYTINEWNNSVFQQITSRLPELNVIYDIGANVGGFTEVMKRKYPNADIYCFEPVPINFEELVKNVPYAQAFQFGIFYGQTSTKLLWRGSNEGAIFVEYTDSGEPRIDRGEVAELKELEDLGIPKPDLIKMDVEGSELNIIEHSAIVKETPYLIVEWHPNQDCEKFFETHLPNHRVLVNIGNNQILLCLKSL